MDDDPLSRLYSQFFELKMQIIEAKRELRISLVVIFCLLLYIASR